MSIENFVTIAVGFLSFLWSLVQAREKHRKAARIFAALAVIVIVVGFILPSAVDKTKPTLSSKVGPLHGDATEPMFTPTPFSAKDDAGRRGDFELDVVSKYYSWKENSAKELENGHSLQDLMSLRERLAGVEVVIAVGCSSKKPSAINQDELARERAAEIAGWVRSYVPGSRKIHMLVVGQYSGSQEDSLFQRRVILIRSVGQLDQELNVEEAIFKGLQDMAARGDGTIKSLLGDYTLSGHGRIGEFQ